MEQHLVELFSTAGKFKMLLSVPGFIEDRIISHGHWEPHLANALCGFMWEGGVFIDVGANIGYHSLFIASACPKAMSIGFEPHPQLFEQMLTNQKISQLPNITVYKTAVGDTNDSCDFYMTHEDCYNKGLSSILHDAQIAQSCEKVKVPSVRLDQFLNEDTRSNVKVVKIDAQGCEYEVLSGAKQLIAEAQPVISFEYHNHSSKNLEDIFSLLPGYAVYRIYAWGGRIRLFDQNDPDMYSEDLDVICIPQRLSESHNLCEV